MAIPRDPDARRYYRAAGQRLDDARAVLEIGRTTASVYLAGYCVECLLKSLILASTPESSRPGTRSALMTHDFDSLRRLYAVRCGGPLPEPVARDLALVGGWAPRLRYDPGTIKMRDANRFLAAVERLWDWANQRL